MLQFNVTLKRVSGAIFILLLSNWTWKKKTFYLSSYFSVCQRSLRIWLYVLCCFHCIRSARLHIIRNRKWKFQNISGFIVHIAANDFRWFRLFGYWTSESNTWTDLLYHLRLYYVLRIAGKFSFFDLFQSIRRDVFSIYFLFWLQNMFLAIINDTYSAVKSENVTSDIRIGTYIKGQWNRMTEKLTKCLPCLKKCQSGMQEKRNGDSEAGSGNADVKSRSIFSPNFFDCFWFADLLFRGLFQFFPISILRRLLLNSNSRFSPLSSYEIGRCFLGHVEMDEKEIIFLKFSQNFSI